METRSGRKYGQATPAKRSSKKSGNSIMDQNGKSRGESQKEKNVSNLRNFLHYNVVPLLLMLITPNFAVSLWYVTTQFHGSYSAFLHHAFFETTPPAALLDMWRSVYPKDLFGPATVLAAVLWAVFWTAFLPGDISKGPVTARGNVPTYKNNGLSYFILTISAFAYFSMVLKTFRYSPSIFYDRLGEILFSLNVFALLLCVFLSVKGRWYPTTNDRYFSGSPIFDFYWGIELYPRIKNVDVKLITNCRVGMTMWGLLCVSYLYKSWELRGEIVDGMLVAVGLSLIYITKFFHWEMGYMRTMDIAEDHAGYYICWGCLVWVPSMYTSPVLYLVENAVNLGGILSIFIFLLGAGSIFLNYWADAQKKLFRETDGNCKIFGAKAKVVEAFYMLDDGRKKSNLLLASGFWGLSRHFHYIPELTAAALWTLPAGFNHILPWFYFLFLCVLLVHRSIRDDRKCQAKYGKYWDRYTQCVPYRLIPGIF